MLRSTVPHPLKTAGGRLFEEYVELMRLEGKEIAYTAKKILIIKKKKKKKKLLKSLLCDFFIEMTHRDAN